MGALLAISLIVVLASPTILLYAKVKQLRTVRNKDIKRPSRRERAEKERRIQDGHNILIKVPFDCEAED